MATAMRLLVLSCTAADGNTSLANLAALSLDSQVCAVNISRHVTHSSGVFPYTLQQNLSIVTFNHTVHYMLFST